MKQSIYLKTSLALMPLLASGVMAADIKPSRSEVIKPIHNATFNQGGKAKQRKQGGGARQVAGCLAFDGSMDGNRQVDPQIAVGGGYVFHGTNNILFWARAIAAERNLNVTIIEPDVSPLAVQGPKAENVVASIFGDWVRGLKYFWFKQTTIEGIPVAVARSGWSARPPACRSGR